ncbi:MAG: Fur family transcriptional regulator [Chloroflexota bacterium]
METIETRWIGQKLSKLGYRLTPQRLMILGCVEDAGSHISAEEIYAQVKVRYPQMNISTVYRTMELLTELGLVTETDFGDGRARYHCMGKGRNHHHLVCGECGGIIDMDESILSSLWASLQQEYNFRVNMKHLAFFGICPKCQT